MTLSDMSAYRQIIGCLIYKPLLFLEYPELQVTDFDYRPAKVIFNTIYKLYLAGAKELSPVEIDQEIEQNGGLALQEYRNGGLDFLKTSYEVAQLSNFDMYYNRAKKCALLRKLQQAKYDISEFYLEDTDPANEAKLKQKLENATLEDILNAVEKNYSEIRNAFLNGGRTKGDPAEGIFQLIDDL